MAKHDRKYLKELAEAKDLSLSKKNQAEKRSENFAKLRKELTSSEGTFNKAASDENIFNKNLTGLSNQQDIKKKLKERLSDKPEGGTLNYKELRKSVRDKADKKMGNGHYDAGAAKEELLQKEASLKPKRLPTEEVLDYKELKEQFKKMNKGLKKGLRSVPVLGSLAALATAEDASAAVPILGEAEAAGMSPEAENMMIAESDAMKAYDQSQARRDRLAALANLLKSGQE